MSPQSPDDKAGNTAVEDKSLDKESMIDFLKEDDKEQETIELEDKKDKQDKSGRKDRDSKEDKEAEGEDGETEEDISLEDELEEDLKEPDEEKLELLEPPRRREILGKYPNLFKDFPQLERSMYREQKYTEILPTIEDAKTAAEKAEILDTYEKEIMESGSTEALLNAVKESDKESFAKLIDNYLPNLYKVDEHSYYHTIGNVIKHTIISMVRDSKEQQNDDLSHAASILNQYIFGTTTFTHPQRLSKEEVKDAQGKAREEEISSKEKAFLEKQFNQANEGVSTKVDNILKATVDKNIDPNDSMSDYVKGHATKQVLDELESLIDKDTRFRGVYDKLWEKAFESDFDKESMDKIQSAYLSKAKTLLPLIIRKARAEALKGSRKSSDNDSERDRKGPLPVGRTRSSATLTSGKSNSNSSSKQIPKGMSTLDFLNSD